MSRFEREFNENLSNFLTYLYSATKDSNVKKLIDIFDKIQTYKTAKKMLSTIGKYSDDIDNKNSSIFNNKFIILSGIDMNKLWPMLTREQINKVWLHLQLLCISANMVVQNSSNSLVITDVSEHMKNISVENTILDSEVSSVNSKFNNFNPYLGVGSDNDFSAEDLFSGPETLKGDSGTGLPNLGAMGGLGALKNVDISKFVDVKTLSSLIKDNVTDENIHLAIEHLREQLGDEMDNKRAKVMEEIFGAVASELKKIDTSGVIRVADILEPMENLIAKINPILKTNEIDMKYVWEITQKISAINGKGNEQMKLLSSFMNQQLSMLSKLKQSGGEVNKEEYLGQCNDILKDLGFKDLDLNKINISQLTTNITKTLKKDGKLNMNNITSSLTNCIGHDNVRQLEGMVGNIMQQPQPGQRGHKHSRGLDVEKMKRKRDQKL